MQPSLDNLTNGAAMEPPLAKSCSKCGIWKGIELFYSDRSMKFGKSSQCKVCRDTATKAKKAVERQQRQIAMEAIEAQPEPTGKTCTKCGEWKLLDKFGVNKSRRYGRTSRCKLCLCEASKHYAANHSELTKERRKAYNQKAERRQKNKERASRYYNQHKNEPEFQGIRRKHQRRYYERYKETDRFRLDLVLNSHRRRARKRAASGVITRKEWRAALAFYGSKCLCCGEEKPLTLDHVVPLSKGGTNTIDNAQPLCLSCNSRKNATTIDYRTAVYTR